MSQRNQQCTIGLLLILLCLSSYRAATQSFTIDEAFNFHLFIDRPLEISWTEFAACNHVLQTWLSRIARRWFGLSELSLRLPTLLGCLLFCCGTYGVVRRLFGASYWMPLATALLAFHPLIGDFSSAARGYGLALGFWMLALHYALASVSEGPDQGSPSLFKSGLCAGLATASSLTFVMPGAALFVALVLLSGSLARLLDAWLLPAITTAFVILVLPLSNALPEHFYVGEQTLAATAGGLFDAAFLRYPARSFVRLSGPETAELVKVWGIPALCLGVAIATLILGGRLWRKRAGLEARLHFLLTATFVLTTAILFSLNQAAHLLYPTGRTGLYLVPLFTLSCLVVVTRFGLPAAVPCALFAALYIAQWSTTEYTEWAFDSSTKRMVATLNRNAGVSCRGGCRLGVSWMLEPSVNFYRRLWDLKWLEPVTRSPPDGTYQYYLLLPEDVGLIARYRLTILDKDSHNGVILASKP